MKELPFLTAEVPAIGGTIRTTLEDFRVEELPAYEPAGEGEHLYVRFEKRGLATPDAVRMIARALGVDPREAGYAGLKDKNAVTVQTASFARADAERALALEVPGVRVLSAVRHKNKLKSGHLKGNRFEVRVRGAAPGAEDLARRVRDRLLAVGVPNYYGAQRFGREGDNAERGRAWLAGGPPPRDHFLRKMYASAIQSELFNAYVSARLSDGVLDAYVDGDLAVRHPGTNPFPIEPEAAPGEYAARRCSATGPMFGPQMRWPERESRARDEKVLEGAGLALSAFGRAGNLAEGTRRAVRVCLESLELRAEPAAEGCDLVLAFELPAGGYATAVLREFRKTDVEGAGPGAEETTSEGESNA